MIIIRDISQLQGKALVATIGFFDGVHVGHRFLLERMTRLGHSLGLETAVITFAEHPRKVLHQHYQPLLLNSLEEKLEHLGETSLDYCILLDFTEELSLLSAKEFIQHMLVQQMGTKILFIGYDHRFGHNREEGWKEYITYGKESGMEVIQAPSYQEEHSHVSSSEIRRLLQEGEVEAAEKLLSYPYQLKGHIVEGFKVGRQLGFPTANIQVDEPYKVIPAVGVYAVYVYLEGRTCQGMLYIGKRPTLNNGENMTLEVHIFNFSGDIYNKEITVAFKYYIRGDIKFDSLDELRLQLQRDQQKVVEMMNDKGNKI